MSAKLHSLGRCVLYLFAFVGSTALAMLLVLPLGLDWEGAATGLLAGVLATLAAAFLLRRKDGDFWRFSLERKWIIRSALLSLAVTYLSQSLQYLAPDSLDGIAATVYYGQPFVDFLSVVLLAPVAEELLFRGLILGELQNCMGNRWAVAVAAALFGCLHMNLLWGLMAFLASCLYGWLRLRTGSLYAPVIAHAASNLLSYLVYYLGGR